MHRAWGWLIGVARALAYALPPSSSRILQPRAHARRRGRVPCVPSLLHDALTEAKIEFVVEASFVLLEGLHRISSPSNKYLFGNFGYICLNLEKLMPVFWRLIISKIGKSLNDHFRQYFGSV